VSELVGCSNVMLLCGDCSNMMGPMTDIISGNPMVVKMIVSFNRSVCKCLYVCGENIDFLFCILSCDVKLSIC